MTDDLISRDSRAVAAIQKLRFFPHAVNRGEGCYLIQPDGRRLLDLSATWGAAILGYAHPAVVEAVTQAVKVQAGASILSAVSGPAVTLAEELLAIVPGEGERRVWLGHSGSDANEAVLRAVTTATRRPRIISFVGAYHGGTSGAMGISGHSSQSHAAKHPGLLLLPYPDMYRAFMDDESGEAVLGLLEYHFDHDCPPDEVAAVFMEPIMSDGGLIVPPPGFFKKMEQMVKAHGILLVCDEVKVGLGRSGLLHCFLNEGIRPDVVTLAKGLGGGLALSAAIGPAEIMDIAQAFAMETTCGNPISASAGLAVIQTIIQQGLPARAAEMGKRFKQGLQELASRHTLIGDIRGRGLAMGVELVKDRETKTPATVETAKVVYRAYELGVVVYYVGLFSNVLELTPPLILGDKEVKRALEVLDRAIGDVEKGRVPDEKIAGFQGW